MLFPGLVVEKDLALEQVPQTERLDPLRLSRLGVQGRGLEEVQGAARVSAGGLRDEGERLVVEPEVPGAEPPGDVPQGTHDDPGDRFRLQRVEHDDLAAREERAVQLEGGVLRRRSDQDDLPRLDVGTNALERGRLPEVLDAWRERGLLAERNGRARLTEAGFLLSDALFTELL